MSPKCVIQKAVFLYFKCRFDQLLSVFGSKFIIYRIDKLEPQHKSPVVPIAFPLAHLNYIGKWI